MLLTLKQARLISGLTQESIAKNLGIHVQSYRKIENSPDSATVLQCKKISEIVGIDYNNIFFGKKV